MPLDNITELKKRVPGGKYALARAVAERARQLQGGATPLTEVKAPNPLSVAIDEIVQGKITFLMNDSEAPDPNSEATNAMMATRGQPAAPATAQSGGSGTAGADKAAAESPLVGDQARGAAAINANDSAENTSALVSEASTKTSTDSDAR